MVCSQHKYNRALSFGVLGRDIGLTNVPSGKLKCGGDATSFYQACNITDLSFFCYFLQMARLLGGGLLSVAIPCSRVQLTT